MNKFQKYIVATLIFIFGVQSIISAQEEIRFMQGSLAAALSIAKERNKSLFIDTYADWCIPCKRMDKVFKDKDVARFYNEHFINLKVNMQNSVKAAEIRRKYDVVFLPTIYILDPNGVIRYQADKELTRDEMLNIGQMMLDPTSYNISDATSVRRNDGTTMHTRSSSEALPPPPKRTPPPKPAIIHKDTPPNIAKSNPTSETSKPSPVASKPKIEVKVEDKVVASSAANEVKHPVTSAEREKYLDQFETVADSKEKVLYVLGANEAPPSEFLLQEAYFRMELMDGSHKKAAKEYLATQTDWNTTENRKFILDFVGDTQSPEYLFIVNNREEFNAQFGSQKVMKVLEVITYRSLHNAVPRPTFEESVVLFENTGNENPRIQAYNYYINRLITEEDIPSTMEYAKEYFKDAGKDYDLMFNVSNFLVINPTNKEGLKYGVNLMEQAVMNNETSYMYLELLGDLHQKSGDTSKAKSIYEKLIEMADGAGKNTYSYKQKLSLLSNN